MSCMTRPKTHEKPCSKHLPRVIPIWGCACQSTCKEERPPGNRRWSSWESGLTDAGLCSSSHVSYRSVLSRYSLLLYQKNDKSIRRDRKSWRNCLWTPAGPWMLTSLVHGRHSTAHASHQLCWGVQIHSVHCLSAEEPGHNVDTWDKYLWLGNCRLG